MKPRRFPRFHKNTTSDVRYISSSQPSKGVSNSVEVSEDFRPFLWQSGVQELSENEISFPIPQLAPSTASHAQLPKSVYSDDAIPPQRGGSRIVLV
jgi:hypothetical protein